MDALEDAVYEKALTSAASDATARRKIEGVFARLVSVPDAEREGEKLGSGGRPPPVNLPIRVFKRGLLVYLNGVEDEDLDALARRYLARGGKTVSVGRFLDGVFHVPPDEQDDLLDPKHVVASDREPGGSSSAMPPPPPPSKSSADCGGIIADPRFWSGGGRKQEGGGNGDDDGEEGADRGRPQVGSMFQKRLARFLLAFRRVVLRKAQEASQSLPAHRRLQTHVGELAEKVSRRLLLEGFHELAAADAKAEAEREAAERRAARMGMSTGSSSSVRTQAHRKSAKAVRHQKTNPHLSREGFGKLLDAFKGPGFTGLDDTDTTMLWQYVGEGAYHDFATLVFAPEVHEERVAGQGRHGKGLGAHDIHSHHTDPAANQHQGAGGGYGNESELLQQQQQQGGGRHGDHNPTAMLGFERGLIEGSRKAPAPAPTPGPFDRTRSGERLIVPPPRAKMPASIKYPQSRTTVSPPSDLDPALVTRSGKTPAEKMNLQHVFGFNGAVPTPALYAAADGALVFPVACVVVVHDSETGKQRLFQGHDDDVTAVAVSDAGTEAASGQTGKVPYVLTWSLKTLTVKHKLGVGFFEECVFALAFSGDSTYLVTVGNSEQPYLGVWDTESGMLMAEMSAAGGKSPPIWQVLCQPRIGHGAGQFDDGGGGGGREKDKSEKNVGRFLTVGNNSHVTFYSFDRQAVPTKYGGGGKSGVPLRRKVGTLGRFGPSSSKSTNALMSSGGGGGGGGDGGLVMHSVAFVADKDNLVASGGSDGRVYLWKHGEPVGSFRADEGCITSMQVKGGDLYTGSSVGLVRKFETEGFSLVKTLTPDDGLRRTVSASVTELAKGGKK